MGAMHRNQYDTMDDTIELGWKLLMFARELQWGVFTVDFEGNETLEAAARDQATAIKVAPAIGEEARHVRIRRLR